MKTARKVLLLVLCAALLVSASIMGTMAYLTDSEANVNTFTVGKVYITMDEADVDEYGVAIENADRVLANEYKLMPGHTYTKDPTIKVAEGSEDCWLFVTVANGIADIEGGSIAAQMKENGWTKIEGTDVYAYKEAVSANAEVPVFKSFTIKDDVTAETLKKYEPVTTGEGENEVTTYSNITVTAYAIQKDGFTTASDAWKAAGAGLVK